MKHEMTEIEAVVWTRLQKLSCEHARIIGPQYTDQRRKRIYVPEVIQENVDMLKRCDEEEMKSRVLWYVQNHPKVFNAATRSVSAYSR